MLTHFNKDGKAKMVDVGEKDFTERTALAKATIIMAPKTLQIIKEGTSKKGDVLGVAQVAGIMGAKKTPDIIPMCHPIILSGIDLTFEYIENGVEIFATTKCVGQTGVEMESLTAVSIAALTIYDMCKAVDKAMVIKEVMLLEKFGGKSDFRR